MALQNTSTGEYLKIDSLQISDGSTHSISYSKYASLEHRESGDTEFLHKQTGSVNSGALQTELGKPADTTKSILDNFKTAGYAAIKADTFEFSTWSDA